MDVMVWEKPRCLQSYSEMEKNEDLVQATGSKTLLIRHLPAELGPDEKEDLLKYFGAETVRVFSTTGRMVSLASLKLMSVVVICEICCLFIPQFIPLSTETQGLRNLQKWEGSGKCEYFSKEIQKNM